MKLYGKRNTRKQHRRKSEMLSYEEFEWEFKKALEEKYPDAKIIRKSQYKFNKIKKNDGYT